MVGLHHS